jgi:phosphate-selective porin OprO/OprP
MHRFSVAGPTVGLALALLFAASTVAQEPPPDPVNLAERLQRAEAELRDIRAKLGTREDAAPGAAPDNPLPNILPNTADADCGSVTIPSKYPTIKISGAFQVDVGLFSQSTANRRAVGLADDGADFRRARLAAAGDVAEHMGYKLQLDFAVLTKPRFADAYFDFTDVAGLDRVVVGQFKQPIGLEDLTSFRHNPFFERSPLFLFVPFRQIGAGLFQSAAGGDWTWALSVFVPGQDQSGAALGDSGGVGGATRLTWCPLYADDGAQVLHLGAAYSLSGPTGGTMRFGATGGNAPEFALINPFGGAGSTPSFVDTGELRADLYNLWGVESAAVWGPLSLQGEAMLAHLDRPRRAGVDFWGAYAFATLFLTGEHRVYDRKRGEFDRVVPLTDFQPWRDGRWWGGAYELAARLSYIDLNDQEVHGGRLADLTCGWNWYLNPYAKMSFNYIHAFLDRPPTGRSNADVFALRGQIEF